MLIKLFRRLPDCSGALFSLPLLHLASQGFLPCPTPHLTIQDSKIRMDKDTGFVCITDIGNLKGGGSGGKPGG